MKPSGRNIFSSGSNEILQDARLGGKGDLGPFGSDWFAIVRAVMPADEGAATGRAAALLAPQAGSGLGSAALTTGLPREGLLETSGSNDSFGTAQAIDRAGLTVTNNSNLYDTSLPSVVIQGSVSVPSDQDYYSITLQAGELLVLDVDGTDGLDSFLRLFSSNGTTLIGDEDDYVIVDPGSELAPTHTSDHHNTDSLIHFRAATAGTYYFSIGSFVGPGQSSSGAYQLNVSVGPPASAAQIAAEDLLALQSGASWNHLNLTYGIPTTFNQYPSATWQDNGQGSWQELDNHDNNNLTSDFVAFNATQSAATAQLLQQVARVTGLTFTQNSAQPGQADIRYAMTNDSGVGNTAYAYFPTNGTPADLGSTAWFSTTNFSNPVVGNYAWMGILHETGHTLGLKHGHEFPIALSADHDSLEFSVMTYRSYPGQPPNGYTNETWGYPTTLMMYDIAALQAMYGANFSTNSGNSVYTWSATTGEMFINGVGQGAPGNGIGGSANRVFETIWDGGGTDTYDLSNYSGGVSIDLNPGGWSTTSAVQLANLGSGHIARGNVFNALQYNGDPRSLIENAFGGAGNDVIVGNAADNRLEGRGGNDQLFGNDGNDAFYFTTDFNALDHVDGGAGTNDQLGLQGDYTGARALTLGQTTITGVEVLAVLGGFSYDITTVDGNVAAGGLLKVHATQLAAGQSLTFNGAAETDGAFFVFGGQGNDRFTGGAGNDAFYFGPNAFTSADIVNGGGGSNDQLGLDGNYTITMGGNVTNVEVLVLLAGPTGAQNIFNVALADSFVAPGQTMTIFGLQVTTGITFDGSGEHDGALRIFGGTAADAIVGSSNADFIFGGNGGDTLTGGGGADTFYYDDVAQSASTAFDNLVGFDKSGDRIDLPFGVTGFGGSASGALSNASMDSTFASIFGGLGNHQFGLFTATSGDLAGHVFAVVDANGITGYQAGADFVIGFTSPVTPLDSSTAIFM